MELFFKEKFVSIKVLVIVLALVGVVLLSIFAVQGVKNRAISYEESIEQADSYVKAEEKRRFDLIPNLAECVKQYDKHEAETLIELAKARSGGAEGDATMKDIKLAIQAVVEAYPQLQSQKNYNDLMDELTITENRVVDNRKIYNSKIADYGRFVRQFPNKQLLGLRGYETKTYEQHKYENNSHDAPRINFGD